MGISKRRIISGERAVSEKEGRKEGRQENIFQRWHHSFRVEAQSFYSHVLSYWHIPRPQSAPPPPPFCPRFLPSTLRCQAKWCDVSAEPRGGRGRGWGPGGVGARGGFGKHSEGRGRNFPEIPLPPSPSDHVCLLFSRFTPHPTFTFTVMIWNWPPGIPGDFFFLLTGILF